jgi:GAF domain-containing protein
MSALSLLSIALLIAALAGCAALWTRSGETRVGLFGALFLLIAIHQAVAAWTNGNDPLGWNVSSFGELAGLAAGVLGVLAVVALWRTLAERDQAEKLHWDSMETVRAINELDGGDSISPDAKIARLLEIGASRFGLEVAMLARVRKDRYEIIAIHSPESFPAAAGAVFSLEETFCKNTLDSDRPVGVERIPESSWAESLHRAAFPFHAYLGAAITVDGASYGTLSFASFEPRKDRFNGTEKDLIRLMAQWIGSEIGKRNEREGSADFSIEDPTLATPAPSPSAARQQRVDEPATAEPKEAPSRTRKRADLLYVERVIDPSTLVMNARDAMPEGGDLVIEATNLEIAGGEPGQMPALAPDRYVTLSFTDSGEEPDAEALSRLFDRAPAGAEQTSSEDRLALSTVYRVLQICGGDLSVKVEPGHGSTFTVYLPRAREQVRAPRKPAPALAPAMPSSPAH